MKETDYTQRPDYRGGNLRQFRGYLRLTQKEILNEFFTDETGKVRFSVATLSNLESKGGPLLREAVDAVAAGIGMDPAAFSLPPDDFLRKLDELELRPGGRDGVAPEEKKGSIAQLVNRLTEYFADEMLTGRLRRGDQVEPDRALAERFSVGRSALREAMKVLDVMGLVDIRPGQGTFISSRDSEFFVIPLMWSLFLNGSQIEQVVTLREGLECQAAFLAAENVNDEVRQKIRELYEKGLALAESGESAGLSELDMLFHITIAECSGNHIIYSLLLTIRNILQRLSRSGMADETQIAQIAAEHRAICEAIMDGRAKEARAAMRVHMDNSRERYSYS